MRISGRLGFVAEERRRDKDSDIDPLHADRSRQFANDVRLNPALLLLALALDDHLLAIRASSAKINALIARPSDDSQVVSLPMEYSPNHLLEALRGGVEHVSDGIEMLPLAFDLPLPFSLLCLLYLSLMFEPPLSFSLPRLLCVPLAFDLLPSFSLSRVLCVALTFGLLLPSNLCR